MSQHLLNTLRISRPHFHSPVDDLQSFYYTAQWAAAFNDGASGRKYDSNDIREFREMISSKNRFAATYIVLSRRYEFWKEVEQAYGPFFTHSAAILHPWLQSLNTLTAEWSSIPIRAEELDDAKRKEYLVGNFLVYGYRGVGEYFELIHEHRALLEMAV